MGEFSTNIFDEPIKKRKMFRRKERLDKEFQDRTGEPLRKKYRLLQNDMYKKKKIIRELREKIKKYDEVKRKELRAQEVKLNRHIRGRETKLKNLKARYDELRKKKGKTVVHHTKKIYKSYESPTKIRNFETICLEARNTNKTFVESFEYITKVHEVLHKVNEETGQVLNITHYLCLLCMYMLRGEIKGVYSTSVNIPSIPTSTIRRYVNYLADNGYLTRIGKLRFRVTILGEQLLELVKNKEQNGKSLTMQTIRKTQGFKDDDDKE